MKMYHWIFSISLLMGTRQELEEDNKPPRSSRESERSISRNLRALNEHLSNADVSLYDLWAS